MPFDITYGEEDAPVPRGSTLPQRRPAPAIPPPPPPGGATGTGVHWFVCGNDQCSRVGHVATGNNDPVHRQKLGGCRECGGIGVDLDGGHCENCEGRGRRVVREWDEAPVNPCPWCSQPMIHLQQGGFPVGYPRMETPHSDEDTGFQGNVSFGRNRIVS